MTSQLGCDFYALPFIIGVLEAVKNKDVDVNDMSRASLEGTRSLLISLDPSISSEKVITGVKERRCTPAMT